LSYWAVIRTEPNREALVCQLLAHVSRETAFPFYFPRIVHRSRKQPLFPTYLFVRINRIWSPVRWTPHVIEILMAGDRPHQLKEEIVDEIRKREDRNGFVKLPLRQRFRKGQQVRIIHGSFGGHIGLYDGMGTKDRQRVLLELLGRKVTIDLPANNLDPLNVVAQKSAARY
jgi:transcriptional antiterminator RfaH